MSKLSYAVFYFLRIWIFYDAWHCFVGRMFREINLIGIDDVVLGFAYLDEIFGVNIGLDYITYAKAKGCNLTGPEDLHTEYLNVLTKE